MSQRPGLASRTRTVVRGTPVETAAEELDTAATVPVRVPAKPSIKTVAVWPM